MAEGVTAALAAYVLWGVSSLYWRLLSSVPGPTLLSFRIICSLAVLVGLLAATGQLRPTARAAVKPANLAIYTASGISIAVNWGAFMWGSIHGHVIETGLGYLIAPLANIGFGAFFFRERLTPPRIVAVVLMLIAVLFLIVRSGELISWVYLAIGLSFGIYSLFRKLGPLGPISGLAVETALLSCTVIMLVALGYVDLISPLYSGSSSNSVLLACGIVSVVPLWLFTTANRLLPLTVLGFLQYALPSTQFLLALTVYHQLPGINTIVSLVVIWIALGIVSVEAVRARLRGATLRRRLPCLL